MARCEGEGGLAHLQPQVAHVVCFLDRQSAALHLWQVPWPAMALEDGLARMPIRCDVGEGPGPGRCAIACSCACAYGLDVPRSDIVLGRCKL